VKFNIEIGLTKVFDLLLWEFADLSDARREARTTTRAIPKRGVTLSNDEMTANQHSTVDGTRFVSEMFVPIRQDSKSFDGHGSVWDEMHSRMDQRRKEWNDEVYE